VRSAISYIQIFSGIPAVGHSYSQRRTDPENTDETNDRPTAVQPACGTQKARHEVRYRRPVTRHQKAEAMKLDGPDELAAILDDICATIGELLVTNAQLKEGMVDDGATETAQEKLDQLKQDTLAAKEKLANLKQRQQHKKELARQRQEHERKAKPQQTEGKSTRSRVALLNGKGRWIGWVETAANGNVNIYDKHGRIVGRELAGLTLDQNGKLFARGRAGLVALGKKLAS